MEKHKCDVKGCRNEGRYCPMHLKLKSAKKPEPIAKKSKKREVLDRTKYAPAAAAFKKANPECAVGVSNERYKCTGKTQHVHHMAGKATTESLLNEDDWLPVCFSCHRAVEENPEWAVQNGFSKSRHSESKLSKLNNNKAA